MAARSMMLLCLAAMIAVAAVGCGGSGDDSSAAGSSEGLTKAQFIKQAEALCIRERGDVVDGFNAYLKRHKDSKKSQDEAFAAMIKAVLLPSVEKEIDKLQALGVPPGDEAQIEAFLDAQQKAVDAIARLDRLPEGASNEKYFEPATRLAKAYGIPHCGQT